MYKYCSRTATVQLSACVLTVRHLFPWNIQESVDDMIDKLPVYPSVNRRKTQKHWGRSSKTPPACKLPAAQSYPPSSQLLNLTGSISTSGRCFRCCYYCTKLLQLKLYSSKPVRATAALLFRDSVQPGVCCMAKTTSEQ